MTVWKILIPQTSSGLLHKTINTWVTYLLVYSLNAIKVIHVSSKAELEAVS